jgi:hypothetical protein
MWCATLKELEASIEKYDERRKVKVLPAIERRNGSTGIHRLGQSRVAYLIMMHRQTCSLCNGD